MNILALFDMDATLLTDEKEITPENLRLLREAYEKYGVQIALATARTSAIAEGFAREIGEACRYVMCANGAIVRDMTTGEYIHDKSIPLDTMRKIIEFCNRSGLSYMVMSPEARYFPPEYKYIQDADKFMVKKFPNAIRFVPDVDKYALDPDTKRLLCCVLGTEEDLLTNYDELKGISGLFIARLSYFGDPVKYPASAYFDIMGEDVHKATAMAKIIEHSGCNMTVAFGDGCNDVEMITAADFGFAMRNADPALMDLAGAVTMQDNNNSGAGRALISFLK